MEEKVLDTLEYSKILGMVQKEAASRLGKEAVMRLRPSSDRQQVENWQEETEEAISLILSYEEPPLFGIYEIRTAARRAAKGGILTMEELLQIAESLREAEALQDYAREAAPQRLVDLIRHLFTSPALEERIGEAIISPDQMADRASPALYSLRQSIRAKEAQIKDRLQSILNKAVAAGELTENFISLRQGRYVLPVKAVYKNRFPGVVHDESGSGATVFIEPIEVVNMNNEIGQIKEEEKEEVQRILADLSRQVALYEEELSYNQKTLVYLDLSFAKAKYALANGGIRPQFSLDRVIDIKQARHPLLGKEVVPIDIRLGKDFNTLIITGPNTGGKTVCLKTLGLMQLMGQSGLHIPAASPAQLGLFDSIYADIGDRQSIEQSLSTFSASMTNVVDILKKADQGSLLLFDEIGSGTDPVEGAALAMAILEDGCQRGIRTVATTHYSELKLFAIRQEDVQNASVEFDVNSLSPTYRLIIGLPGKSNAFEISKRLGMPAPILAKARERVSQENKEFEDVLADIEENRKRAEGLKERAERLEGEYRDRLAALEREEKKERSRREEREREAKRQAAEYIARAQEEAQSLIRQAKEAAKGKQLSDLDRSLNAINEQSREAQRQYETPLRKKVKIQHPPQDLKVGEAVRLVSLGENGILASAPDENGEVLVQLGILKIHANIRDLVRSEEEEGESPQSPAHLIQERKAMNISSQIDLRGQRYAEALSSVDAYLDDAVLAGLKEVRIIHGKGTGALRQGIHTFLKKDKRVQSFKLADPKQGGAGATEVVLR